MVEVRLFQIKKTAIVWYLTDSVASGELIYFYKNKQAEEDDNSTSLVVVDVIKKTEDYFYIVAEM